MDDVPVILVHGFASSYERNWREPGWADLLHDEDRRVIGVDLLGHGQAARPRDPAAYSSLEQSILTAMPRIGPVDAVGFSLGAQLLLRAAAATPGRFRRIVVAGTGDGVFASTDPEPAARAVETGQADEAAGPVAAALAHFARAPGNDRAALAACLRRPHAPLTEAEVAAIRARVLVVLGDRDFAGPADRLVAALPDVSLVILPGTDHFGTLRDFRFVQAALDFLCRDDSAAGRPGRKLLQPAGLLPRYSGDEFEVLVEVQDGEPRGFGCRGDQQAGNGRGTGRVQRASARFLSMTGLSWIATPTFPRVALLDHGCGPLNRISDHSSPSPYPCRSSWARTPPRGGEMARDDETGRECRHMR